MPDVDSSDNLKILVMGCGSAGSRHARNLAELGLEVYLCDTNPNTLKVLAEELGTSKLFTDYQKALASDVHAVIIATPNNYHAEHGFLAVRYKKHILMEKPIAGTLQEARLLRDKAIKAGLIFMMAHTYRFRTEWQHVQQWLEKFEIGKIRTAQFTGGWYLPDWHHQQDYRKEYAAKKDMGGGVVLTGLSHILDLVGWLFGGIVRFSGLKCRVGNLEIDVEDVASCTMLTDKGVLVTVHENFLERCPYRKLRITADLGYYEFDFIKKKVKVWTEGKCRFNPLTEKMKTPNSFYKVIESGILYDLKCEEFPIGSDQASTNLPYVVEVQYFINRLIEGKIQFPLDANAGVRVMELLDDRNWESWHDS